MGIASFRSRVLCVGVADEAEFKLGFLNLQFWCGLCAQPQSETPIKDNQELGPALGKHQQYPRRLNISLLLVECTRTHTLSPAHVPRSNCIFLHDRNDTAATIILQSALRISFLRIMQMQHEEPHRYYHVSSVFKPSTACARLFRAGQSGLELAWSKNLHILDFLSIRHILISKALVRRR